MDYLDRLVFVDCEASGPAPGLPGSELTEFAAVHFTSRQTFYGRLWDTEPIPQTPSHAPVLIDRHCQVSIDGAEPVELWIPSEVFGDFQQWLEQVVPDKRPVFITDNLAFDWQWINHGFHLYLGANPFGFSGRRIGDFYVGLTGDFSNQKAQNSWKSLRVTKHDHNPVHDAAGNAEAFERILKGERA